MSWVKKTDLTQIDVRLAVTDTPFADLPCKIRCREAGHHDPQESMAVYSDGIKCYGCGRVVSRRMEALAYLLYGDTARWREAIAVAAAYTFQAREHHRRNQAKELDPLPNVLATLYHDYLFDGRQFRLQWLAGRGLTLATIHAFLLGHDGSRFTIPVYDCDKRLLSIRFRRDGLYEPHTDENARSKYCGMVGRNGEYLYPAWRIAESQPETLYVFEGELDTILAWQFYLPSVTITNGAGNLHKLPAMIRAMFPCVKYLIVVGDMDEPGRAAALRTMQAAREVGFMGVSANWWPLAWGKDLTERLQNGYPLTKGGCYQ